MSIEGEIQQLRLVGWMLMFAALNLFKVVPKSGERKMTIHGRVARSLLTSEKASSDD